jgi:HAD superfamily hydrolase (TIGR01509 family)
VSIPFDPHRVRAILFDLDGTLADTDDLLVDRLARRLVPWRARLPQKDSVGLARRLLMNADQPFNTLYAWADRLYLDEAFAFVTRLFPIRQPAEPPPPVPAVPGAVEAVRTLAGSYGVGLVTTRSERSAVAMVQALGLTDYFGVVATARSTRRIKPHPAPVRWAAAHLGIEPSACVMVGDTGVDMASATAAGAQAVGVTCGFGDAQELFRAGAQAVIGSPADLPALLGPSEIHS